MTEPIMCVYILPSQDPTAVIVKECFKRYKHALGKGEVWRGISAFPRVRSPGRSREAWDSGAAGSGEKTGTENEEKWNSRHG